MMRRVWPLRTGCDQGARGGTISSRMIGPRPASAFIATSATEIVVNIQKSALAFRGRVADRIVRWGGLTTPGAGPDRRRRIGGARVEPMWTVRQHHEQIHFGAQRQRASRRERP